MQFNVGSFPQCGPLADRWDVVVSKKEKKVFTHDSGPLNGILVPLTAKSYPKKKVPTRRSVTSNGNRGPLTAMWSLQK